ncbi:hypothetical protein DY000_02033979 [Brassica cretica]|uniref:Fatty acid desaturase N-terminal domain-containing protein n=1 Tax=Brassica cretica TaxID=69181 RepID=A0ABQ7DX37_BRACR|nr:hypothetical protein DY000_02033979 [Brassica cretica]
MGAGGRMQVYPPSNSPETNTLKRVPCETPPFTLGDLKKAIPPHCFKRSIPCSFSYLLFDILVSSSLYHLSTAYFPLLLLSLSSSTAMNLAPSFFKRSFTFTQNVGRRSESIRFIETQLQTFVISQLYETLV